MQPTGTPKAKTGRPATSAGFKKLYSVLNSDFQRILEMHHETKEDLCKICATILKIGLLSNTNQDTCEHAEGLLPNPRKKGRQGLGGVKQMFLCPNEESVSRLANFISQRMLRAFSVSSAVAATVSLTLKKLNNEQIISLLANFK
jgi:hypothetical protein